MPYEEFGKETFVRTLLVVLLAAYWICGLYTATAVAADGELPAKDTVSDEVKPVIPIELTSTKQEYYTAEIKQMFSRLNVNYPGLEAVKAALSVGDYDTAKAEYLKFYRNRTTPIMFWTTVYPGEDSFKVRSTYFDYFTTCPDRITWRDRDTLKNIISRNNGYEEWQDGFHPSKYNLVKLADLILQNKTYHPWWPWLPVQDMGANWDWSHIPGDGDQSWNSHLHHQEFLLALAQAYWQTGDERYVRKLVELWTDWISKVNTAVNLSHLAQPLLYQDLLPFALSWDKFQPQDFAAIQAWLAVNNADLLMGDPRAGNQLMGTGKALLWLGIGMPEFNNAQSWREEGFRRIESFQGNSSSYPDGSAQEPCFHYAVSPCRSVLDAIRLADLNGISYPSTLEPALLRSANFFAYTSKPDGEWVWNGDGGRGSSYDYVTKIAKKAGSEDLKYISSFGALGKLPAMTSSWFAYAGYGTMRSGWTKDSNYLFFDVGPFGISHQHEGKLHVEIVPYGRSMVEDLGIHTYSLASQEIPMLKFMTETSGHNTVIVDGKSQVRLKTGPWMVPAPLPNPWLSTSVCDYLSGDYSQGYGTYSGYTTGLGSIDTSVQHYRSVVFVKAVYSGAPEYWVITDRLKGTGTHSYQQMFHMIPVATTKNLVTKIVKTTTTGKPNLAFIPSITDGVNVSVVSGQTTPSLQGWYLTGHTPAPAPCVIYSRNGAPPASFQTIVWPMRAGAKALPTVEHMGDAQSGWVKVTLPDGRIDIYASPSQSGRQSLGEITFDGEAALVRTDCSGNLLTWEVIRGNTLKYKGRIYTK